MEQDLYIFNNSTTREHITSTYRKHITSTTSRHQPPTSPPQFFIRFNFSCKSMFSFWYSDSYSLDHHPRLEGIDSLPPQVCSTDLDLRELLDNKARRLIFQRLPSRFPIRRLWIDQALEKARGVVRSMPAGDNNVVINFHVIVHHAMVYYEEVAPMVEDDGANFMVPASESWIESVVEKKIVMDPSGTCTVCLDDFSDGSEGVSMPCEHVFHGDCIAEWLRTSHYCPVCRFEFPTD